MKVYVDLTENELRALRSAIWNGIGACSGSCIYTEMQTKNTECSNCPYVKALDSLRKKFTNPQSLSDYTKQVRKEVCEEIGKNVAVDIINFKVYVRYDNLAKILDQIQGETECQKN